MRHQKTVGAELVTKHLVYVWRLMDREQDAEQMPVQVGILAVSPPILEGVTCG